MSNMLIFKHFYIAEIRIKYGFLFIFNNIFHR